MIPKPLQKKLSSYCLLVTLNESTKQWQCKEWYHKTGFITASKCKRVFTRQETLEPLKMPKSRSCEVMSTSHPGGKRTTKRQGVGVVS